MLRVGIDLTATWRPTRGPTGIALSLTRALLTLADDTEYTLFVPKQVPPTLRDLASSFRAQICPVQDELVAKHVWFPWQLPRHRLDVMHYPVFPPPVIGDGTHVMTFHDATAWLFPETMSLKGWLYFRLVGSRGARRSLVVMTDSECARQDLINCLGLDPSRVRVVYPGVEACYRRLDDRQVARERLQARGVPTEYILSVSAIEPRKNFVGLIEAYNRFKRRGFTGALVIAGHFAWGYKQVREAISRNHLERDVILLNHMPPEVLVDLYNCAVMFVLPSWYEGFGIPPVEAMASGCPVIVSTGGSLPEVVGDAALIVEPSDTQAACSAMEKLWTDEQLRAHLVRKGLMRAKMFSWRNAAIEALAIYRAAASEDTSVAAHS